MPKSSATNELADLGEFCFAAPFSIASVQTQPPPAVLQGLLGWGKSQPKTVVDDWAVRVSQMRMLVDKAAVEMPGDLSLDSVTFSLAFSVEGGIWFFAKAGAEAMVEVTFKRKA